MSAWCRSMTGFAASALVVEAGRRHPSLRAPLIACSRSAIRPSSSLRSALAPSSAARFFSRASASRRSCASRIPAPCVCPACSRLGRTAPSASAARAAACRRLACCVPGRSAAFAAAVAGRGGLRRPRARFGSTGTARRCRGRPRSPRRGRPRRSWWRACRRSSRSCETKISVPPKSSSASSSTSFESRSRWLVGSSSSSVFGGPEQHARDGEPRALAAGEHAGFLVDVVAREQKAAEDVADHRHHADRRVRLRASGRRSSTDRAGSLRPARSTA